jgi:hypothetical protein
MYAPKEGEQERKREGLIKREVRERGERDRERGRERARQIERNK